MVFKQNYLGKVDVHMNTRDSRARKSNLSSMCFMCFRACASNVLHHTYTLSHNVNLTDEWDKYWSRDVYSRTFKGTFRSVHFHHTCNMHWNMFNLSTFQRVLHSACTTGHVFLEGVFKLLKGAQNKHGQTRLYWLSVWYSIGCKRVENRIHAEVSAETDMSVNFDTS